MKLSVKTTLQPQPPPTNQPSPPQSPRNLPTIQMPGRAMNLQIQTRATPVMTSLVTKLSPQALVQRPMSRIIPAQQRNQPELEELRASVNNRSFPRAIERRQLAGRDLVEHSE